jgi:hypothetical protein
MEATACVNSRSYNIVPYGTKIGRYIRQVIAVFFRIDYGIRLTAADNHYKIILHGTLSHALQLLIADV